jgi:hypothetical protein
MTLCADRRGPFSAAQWAAAVWCLAFAASGLACGATSRHSRPGDGPDEPDGGGAGSSSNSSGGSAGDIGAGGATSPGRTILRRLNRTEYKFTVRDLLGTKTTPGDQLPDDEQSADGFDTVGEFLSLDAQHITILQSNATQLIEELYARPETDPWRAKVLPCQLTAGAEATCARQVLTAFARRAFRRPVTSAEIDRLMDLVDKARVGETYEDGLKTALSAVLLSPHFIYREETSVAPGGDEPQALNAYELATRLSYFLWSTMPDDELAVSADSGKLTDDSAELGAQVERMLEDEKASTLTTRFANRWLTLDRLKTAAPEPTMYPSFDEELRVSAGTETATFFSHLISDNLPLSNLIDADFTYANDRLGKHYGISVAGAGFSKVSLAGTPRAGILGQTSFLMGTSMPNRSSPVFRGDWILTRILCSATPPGLGSPPMNDPAPGKSGRNLVEDYSKDASCASCHQSIDPMGFAFENFDGIGAYRTLDNGVPVDATGNYPDGTNFDGAVELTNLMAKDPRYPACVTSKLLTYGVGRPFSDQSELDYAKAIAAAALAAQQGQWQSWIAMVAASEAFRTNRPDAP